MLRFNLPSASWVLIVNVSNKNASCLSQFYKWNIYNNYYSGNEIFFLDYANKSIYRVKCGWTNLSNS